MQCLYTRTFATTTKKKLNRREEKKNIDNYIDDDSSRNTYRDCRRTKKKLNEMKTDIRTIFFVALGTCHLPSLTTRLWSRSDSFHPIMRYTEILKHIFNNKKMMVVHMSWILVISGT